MGLPDNGGGAEYLSYGDCDDCMGSKWTQYHNWNRTFETIFNIPPEPAPTDMSNGETELWLANEIARTLRYVNALMRKIVCYRPFFAVETLATRSIDVLNNGIFLCKQYAKRHSQRRHGPSDEQQTMINTQEHGQHNNLGHQLDGQQSSQGNHHNGQQNNQGNQHDGQQSKQGIQHDEQANNQGNQDEGQQNQQSHHDDRQQRNQGNQDDRQQNKHSSKVDGQPNKKEQRDFLDELLQNYNQFLADLKSSPVTFIHTIKKANKKGKIVVNVKKTKADAVRGEIENLPNYETYKLCLEIVECAPSIFLMQNDQTNSLYCMPSIGESQRNIRVGSGSLLAVVNDDEIEPMLRNKHARTLQEIASMYSIPSAKTGTITCLAKYKNQFYAMTSQHVMDIHSGPSSGHKPIITQVHYESGGLQLADIVHLSSSYFGYLGSIPVGSSNNAVDVTLLPIAQSSLDVSSLTSLEVFRRSDSHGPDSCQNSEDYLQDREVTKRGGITGVTKGIIEYPHLHDNMDLMNEDTSSMGDMVGVVSLEETPFASKGDSGSLVTITLPDTDLGEREYAFGIISQIDAEEVVWCVRMEDCLKALESVNIYNEHIKASEIQIYTGFLKPLVYVHNRKRPHMEVSQ